MNAFRVGVTYKLESYLIKGLKLVLKAEFKGEEGVFTVTEIADGSDSSVPKGAARTDDITSPLSTDRCAIPAHIVNECTVVEVVDG